MKTHIAVVLDESGSMGGSRQAVIDGYNEFLLGLRKELTKKEAKDVLVSLSLFDAYGVEPTCRRVLDSAPLDKAKELGNDGYAPRGGTPLYDAIGAEIARLDKSVNGDKAMMVVFTDGYENSSTEYTSEQVREMIREREAKDWEFIYLGANHDAWAAGGAIGASHSISTTSSPVGMASNMAFTTRAATLYAKTDKATYDTAMASIGSTIPEEGLTENQNATIQNAIDSVKDKS